jgi:hypothetical protein
MWDLFISELHYGSFSLNIAVFSLNSHSDGCFILIIISWAGEIGTTVANAPRGISLIPLH